MDVEVAARSEVAAGSEVAGAAAAGSLASGSMTSGPTIGVGGPGGPAAHPGERAACAKSHDFRAIAARRGRLARRQDRPPTGVRSNPDRGCHLHHALGLYGKPHPALDLWPRVELWLPRLLGTERNADGGSVSDANSRCGKRCGLGHRLFRRIRSIPIVTVALQQHTGSFAPSFLCIPELIIAMAIGVTLIVSEQSGKELNEIIA